MQGSGLQLYKRKSLWQRCFTVNFAKFLRTPFLTEYIWQLLLKSVKTACVCIVFFFYYFKYYDQNIFSKTTVLYLIAKVERKELYLKHEIILYQKEKRNKNFQVKTISKDVRKTIVPSFRFLFNSFEVCHPLCKENRNIQFLPLNQWSKK